MTLGNKKNKPIEFHAVRISHKAFIALKEKNFNEYKNGIARKIGETATDVILAGV